MNQRVSYIYSTQNVYIQYCFCSLPTGIGGEKNGKGETIM